MSGNAAMTLKLVYRGRNMAIRAGAALQIFRTLARVHPFLITKPL
jgi:hypothetical protein